MLIENAFFFFYLTVTVCYIFLIIETNIAPVDASEHSKDRLNQLNELNTVQIDEFETSTRILPHSL